MRVYLPATVRMLERLLEVGEYDAVPLTGFGVTPGLQAWYAEDDVEELEYAALLEAARASLRLLDADPAVAPRRVVVAADIGEQSVRIRDDLDRGVVQIMAGISLAAVASVHVDDPDAEEAVRAGAAAVTAADLGDDAAQDLMDDVEGFELSWYASQEIGALLDLL